MRLSFYRFAGAVAISFLECALCCAESLEQHQPRFETYATADYSGRSADLSTNLIWSILGPIGETGPRLKADGLTNLYGGTDANLFSSTFQVADLKAVGDVMAGYQFQRGTLWLKVYAGAAYQQNTFIIWDIGKGIQQHQWGAAAAIESYWRITDRVWFSANVSWLQFDNATSFSYRAGYEFYRTDEGIKLSGGGEAGLAVSNANVFKEGKPLNLYNDFTRGGAFLNLRYHSHELTLSGGLSQASDETVSRPYATLSYGKKF